MGGRAPARPGRGSRTRPLGPEAAEGEQQGHSEPAGSETGLRVSAALAVEGTGWSEPPSSGLVPLGSGTARVPGRVWAGTDCRSQQQRASSVSGQGMT